MNHVIKKFLFGWNKKHFIFGYHNNCMYSDMIPYANSVDPNQTGSSLIGVYIICHLACNFVTVYHIV